MTKDEKKAFKILQSTTIKRDNQFEVGLLWKDGNPTLPNNELLAIKRLHSTEKRLNKNPEFRQKYHDTIQSHIDNGYARKLSEEESKPTAVTNYLPHHGVVQPHKPDKIRVVFDATAKCNNTSLNDHLLPGLDLLNNLVSVLIRFRRGKIATSADIEQMFHQIKVPLPDQHALRFLWRNNPTDKIEKYVMTVHLQGKIDSPCCANWSLKNCANELDSSNLIRDTIENDFYMDDYLGSHNTELEAIETVQKLLDTLKVSGFRLRKWTSNSKEVLKTLPLSELSPKLDPSLSEIPNERVLGIEWNPTTDTISIDLSKKNQVNTKRGILSLIALIFDPLGIVSPALIEPKLIIQELW